MYNLSITASSLPSAINQIFKQATKITCTCYPLSIDIKYPNQATKKHLQVAPTLFSITATYLTETNCNTTTSFRNNENVNLTWPTLGTYQWSLSKS